MRSRYTVKHGVVNVGKIIGLDVPELACVDKVAFDIRSRQLSAWIDNLPRANVGETAKQIYTILQQTNQLSYPYQDRIRFLEALAEPVEYVTNSMKKHFVAVSLPLPEKSQKIAAITKALFSNMAIGYKTALENTLANNFSVFDKKLLVMLTHRSIHYTGQSFLSSYQSYSHFASTQWGELHKLYAFAEKRKLLKNKVRNKQHTYVKKSSISTEYARILLLSLASPYHLRQGESGIIYNALERWLDQPIIRLFNTKDKGSNQYVDNLSQAIAPFALSLTSNKDVIDTAELRIVDTHNITEKIEYELKNTKDVGFATIINSETISQSLPHHLLNRLLNAWDRVSDRQFPRIKKNEQIKITIGLSAAHQFITQKARAMNNEKYTQTYNDRAHFQASEIKPDINISDKITNDVWGLNYSEELIGQELFLEDQKLSLQGKYQINIEDIQINNETKQYQADSWLIVNESAKGVMINDKDEFNNKVQVGDLTSISRQKEAGTEKWSIGVIRWLKSNQGKKLQMGIETLNPNSAAIGIRATNTPNAPLQRTLMLPELINLQQPACLITSSAPWKEGQKITINMLGKDIPATLGKSMQNTGSFAQFQFEINSEKAPVEQVTKINKEQDFTQTWPSI